MARTYTREEFYELVWSKPMTQLAKEFGLSDVALHKTCRRHNIPNPPLGWWAKKAAGHSVKRIPLPKAADFTAGAISIATADLNGEGEALAGVRERARMVASDAGDDEEAPPHPVVDRTIGMLKRAKPSEVGIATADAVGVIRCAVTVPSIDRLAIVLPRIVKAASLQGFTLAASQGPAKFESESEAISFSINESIRREKHIPTDKERIAMEAWERKRERAARLKSWDSAHGGPRFPEWDYCPTGRLAFEFEDNYFLGGAAPRRSFRDGRKQRLENMASDIAVGLAVLAAAKAEDRLKREAQERKREEERRRREQAARVKHIEDRRAAGLGTLLAELDELDRLRRLIGLLPTGASAQEMPRVAILLAWAKEHLAKREARLSPQGIEDQLTSDRLFGNDDDHGFTQTRWR